MKYAWRSLATRNVLGPKDIFGKWPKLPIVIAILLAIPTSLVQTPAQATTTITVFAGTGTAGFSGDGSAASSALLNQPQAVVTDNVGNIYFADNQNHRIRQVDSSGNIHTVVGDGTNCSTTSPLALTNSFTTDNPGICASSGYAITGNGLGAGPAGMLYNAGGWVDETSPGGSGPAWHVAGKVTGSYYPGDGATFSESISPYSLAGSASGMYFAEANQSGYPGESLKLWSQSAGVSTVAGMSGQATCNYYPSDGDLALGECIHPQDITMWSHYVYFFDSSPGWKGAELFRLDLTESPMHLHKIAGSGSFNNSPVGYLAINSGIANTGPIAVSNTGEVYFGNTSNGDIRMVDTTGILREVTNFGAGEGGLAFDASNNLYASLPSQNKIMKISGLNSIASKGNLVALGDSVAAGEGINYGFLWSPSTSQWTWPPRSNPTWTDTTSAKGANYQDCHQTDYAYSRQVQANGYNVYNMACTGASVFQNSGLENGGILDNQNLSDGTTQLGGICPSCAPVNTTYDSLNPAVVTLTVGADDINFATWVGKCYQPFYFGAKCGTSDDNALVASQLANQEADLRSALAELDRRAGQDLPSGQKLRVLVTNYYNPFQSSYASCIDTSAGYFSGTYPGIGINSDQQTWLVNGLNSLNGNINSEVGYAQTNDSHLNVSLVDLSTVMAGHQWCTSDPWMYGPSIDYPPIGNTGPGTNPAPFHPTPSGQNAIYQAVLQQGHL